ncbi:putative lipoprotein [[Clostridium] bifermentans ATCC 638]|uniref:Putative lipoprotein n=1 Tax=Paraclostridium bifermentans ATCC 638 = DSM 14991 TaxID=1233171 RepID=T4VI33_PARBF|nr:hypothetical protein [Paraclostridium bifermentans]EQK43379.1 putative lipoprotein [[Clostridium] bifermentans ATCC 638] [Paraclostridium bifermentans ATCC 638 = DSM 14991]RIZ60594.1 hypothetical protein CHH45_02120 [Paraclostridium bifermentans]UAG17235.1 hypothetical protein KXZ80_10625 [Paraclostridium bifermentans]
MNKLKRNITLFLTVFIFAITCAFTFSIEKSYATSNKNEISNVEYQVAKGSSSHSSHSSHSSSRSSSSFKSSSSSFKSSSSTSKPSSSSSKPSSSYTKPKSSTTKPDSGSFSTKPKPETTINEGTTGNNSNNNTTKPKSSTTKPDSGSFSTKPDTSSKSNQNDTSNSKNKKNDEYDDYGGRSSRRTYIPPAYGRGFFGFGGYNPFRYMGYRMGISPMIMDIVMIITALIVLYVIIDFIRSRKNR